MCSRSHGCDFSDENLLNHDQDTIKTKQTRTVFGSDATAEAPAQGAQNQCFSGGLSGREKQRTMH